MTDPKSFLDNLNNLRLVTSVALEYIQANLTHFVMVASANQVRQCERLSAKSELLQSTLKENSTRLSI